MYTLLLTIIYLTFISLGLPDSLLGSAWPIMKEELSVSLSYAGYITLIIQCGTIVSSLLTERLTKKLGTKYVVVISVALTAIVLYGFSTVKSFQMICLWAIPYGLGAGAIDSALNNYVAIHYSSKHMNWLHSFWGLGTIISPYVMSFALSNYTWKMGYRLVSYIQIIIVLILIITLPVWNKNKIKDENVDEDKEVYGFKTIIKIKGVIFQLIAFFAYCSLEQTSMLWASSYLVSIKMVESNIAAACASLFCIGITLGRFISGFISEKLGDKKMIYLGCTITLLGILGIVLPLDNTILSFVGFVLIGLGCAPIYPAIIHSTPLNFGKKYSQAIIAYEMASAYVGSALIPTLFGILANKTSLIIMPYFLLCFLILLSFMTYKVNKETKS